MTTPSTRGAPPATRHRGHVRVALLAGVAALSVTVLLGSLADPAALGDAVAEPAAHAADRCVAFLSELLHKASSPQSWAAFSGR